MKKFILYVLFVFACGFGGYFGYSYKLRTHYADTAVPYVQQVLPVLSSWDAAALQNYLAAEVLAQTEPGQLEKVLGFLSKIGTLEEVGEIELVNKKAGPNSDGVKTALLAFVAQAEYSTGPAKVTISLLEKEDRFKLSDFSFEAEALLK